MKYDTLKEINTLREILNAKLDRIGALERIVASMEAFVADKTNKTTAQIREALRDIEGTKKEIEDEEAWCVKAKARIAKFYAPATLVS